MCSPVVFELHNLSPSICLARRKPRRVLCAAALGDVHAALGARRACCRQRASRGGTRSEVRLIHLRLSTQLVCQGLCLCAQLCCCLRSSATPQPRGSAAPRLHGGSAAPRGAARRCGGTARQIGCGLSRPATAVRGATRVVVVMVVVTTARACHAEEIPGCATSHWPNKRRSTKAGSGFLLPRELPLRALLFLLLFPQDS